MDITQGALKNLTPQSAATFDPFKQAVRIHGLDRLQVSWLA